MSLDEEAEYLGCQVPGKPTTGTPLQIDLFIFQTFAAPLPMLIRKYPSGPTCRSIRKVISPKEASPPTLAKFRPNRSLLGMAT